MSKLIVISNRVAVPGFAKKAGGLSVAIEAALRQRRGTWLGWNGSISTPNEVEICQRISVSNLEYVTFGLSEREHQLYYNSFSNQTLWPALHYREDLIKHSKEALGCYQAVNEKFADHALQILSGNDILWIHDYHLFGLGYALRRRGVKNPIGFFLHVPFPPAGVIETLPPDLNLSELLASYDLIGVQTQRDAEHVRRYLASHSFRIGEGIGPRRKSAGPNVEVFPVGIQTDLLSRAARLARKSTIAKMTSAGLAERAVMISVERLDYSKGIPQRLKAYEQFLSAYPEWTKRVSLVQIAPLSRETLPEYADLANDVDSLSGRINGRYADLSWNPIHYTNAYVAPFALAGFLRAARVGIVTPLRDGMNLVSKEYVATQDPLDPGVLILSKFAGAADQLLGALQVDPRQIERVGAAIKEALEMPADERRSRHSEMMSNITAQDARAWCDSFIAALSNVK